MNLRFRDLGDKECLSLGWEGTQSQQWKTEIQS